MMSVTTWEDELRAAAKLYADGWSKVRERRAKWRENVDQVVLPTLGRACEVLGAAGLEARADASRDRANASDVELRLAPFPTELTWRDKEGREVHGIERPAAMGYGQGDDGRIAYWRVGHSLVGDPPSLPRVIAIFGEPDEITASVVEKHVTDFLRDALPTSIRGEPKPIDRPIGFAVPEPSD